MNQKHFTLQNSIQYLKEYNGFQEFTQIKLTDHNKKRYIYPVLTLKCIHIKYATNLETVLDEINLKGLFVCECKNTANHPSQLQKDIRWGANEEINEIFDEGTVIHNKLFHNFQRARRYNAALTDQIVLSSLKKLLEQQNSRIISKILQRQGQNFQNQKNIIFKAICLLDSVSLNIPVRFNNCEHPECYDLASLLVYLKENSKIQGQADKLIQFQCKQRTCQVKVDISTVKNLFDNIYIDKELLKLIQKGLPSIYKYIYNPNSQQIQQDFLIQSKIIVDRQIYQRYQQEVNQQALASNEAYQQFQKLVMEFAHSILQRTSIVQTEQKLRLFKYKEFEVQPMIEKIEQPARCINCHISQVMELKYLLSDFQKQKDLYKQQIRPLICPLCQNNHKYTVYIPNVIYFDKNLFDAQEQGFLEKSGEIHIYNGKKLMKEEFQQKQKVELEEFKKILQNENQNQVCTFTQLYCCSNPAIRISWPLVLKNCPEQRIVDFESFYNRIQQLDVKNYHEKCLKFCNCQYCSDNPFSFEEIVFNVYYHEAFYIALTQFNKSKLKFEPYQFTYDFQSNRIIEESIHTISSKSIIINEKSFIKGFKTIQDEYQAMFDQKQIQGYQYQIVSNQLTTQFAIIENTREGYIGESKTQLKEINEKIQNNKVAKQYRFEIDKTEFQTNGFIKLARGNVSWQQN
ncbi:unnamed protein product [Paramecium octaurelia]|uniref:Uncharacterized protein n=1 Tax=Paramecium octaurelia TaxID=43137 RepID=A0A8S1WIY8_PAROT|nr:unnamed protein product [Paramecium octaurelia]